MANKMYQEEYVKAIAKALRVKLATPNTKAVGDLETDTTLGKKFALTEMEEAVSKIPVRLGFPSGATESISIETIKYSYIAPENGWVYYHGEKRSSNYDYRKVKLTNVTKGISTEDMTLAVQSLVYGHYDAATKKETYAFSMTASGVNQKSDLIIPVTKGDEVKLDFDGVTSSSDSAFFVYENEYENREFLTP